MNHPILSIWIVVADHPLTFGVLQPLRATWRAGGAGKVRHARPLVPWWACEAKLRIGSVFSWVVGRASGPWNPPRPANLTVVPWGGPPFGCAPRVWSVLPWHPPVRARTREAFDSRRPSPCHRLFRGWPAASVFEALCQCGQHSVEGRHELPEPSTMAAVAPPASLAASTAGSPCPAQSKTRACTKMNRAVVVRASRTTSDAQHNGMRMCFFGWGWRAAGGGVCTWKGCGGRRWWVGAPGKETSMEASAPAQCRVLAFQHAVEGARSL